MNENIKFVFDPKQNLHVLKNADQLILLSTKLYLI